MPRKHNPKSVVIIGIDGKTRYFTSVEEAADRLGFYRQRLFEALASESGLIRNTDPPQYIDYATYDGEDDEEDY